MSELENVMRPLAQVSSRRFCPSRCGRSTFHPFCATRALSSLGEEDLQMLETVLEHEGKRQKALFRARVCGLRDSQPRRRG